MSTTEIRFHEATFRALGSNCRIISDVEPTVMAAVHRLEDLESRWSRFRPDSEVSLVNAYAGSWVEVSAVTTTLFARAAEACERTGGLVNPLMLNDLLAHGYDRSHETLDRTAAAVTNADLVPHGQKVPGPEWPSHLNTIEIEGAAVRIPEETGFDPGGVGKGLIADMVLADLLDAGSTWAMVSLGGDICFGGAALAAKPIGVQIDDPLIDGGIWGSTMVSGGALATSSTMVRRWNHDGIVNHHLLDPRTGRPCHSPRVAATVAAESGWWADVVAKSLIIDPTIGSERLAEWNAKALVFTDAATQSFSLDAQRAVE